MNPTEFKTWWGDFGRVFPETAAWVNGLGPEGKRTLLAAWEGVLRETDPRDAAEVTRRMLAGDDETLPAYEREKTPAHVRHLAWEAKRRRTPEARDDSDRPADYTVRTKDRYPAGQLFADLMLAREQGATSEQLAAMMAEFKSKYSKPSADYDGPRFHCGTCLDSGMVFCWDHRALAAMRSGGIDSVRLVLNPVRGMLCSCRRGDRKGDGPMRMFGRYSVSTCYLCPRGDYRDEANLLAFAAEFDTANSAKRVDAFDEWNQG